MRQKLLFISSHGLADETLQGGHLVAYLHLEELAKWSDVYCICLRNPLEAKESYQKIQTLCRQVIFLDLCASKKLLNALSHPNLPIFFSMRYSKTLLRLISSLVNTHQIERVHLEWAHLSALSKTLKALCPQIKLSLFSADIISDDIKNLCLSSSGLKRLFWKWDYARTIAFERKHYPLFDRLYVVGKEDRLKLLNYKIPPEKIMILPTPFGIHGQPRKRNLPSNNEPLNIVFWGAYSRYQNVHGALYLIDQLFPEIQKIVPQAKIIILGSNPPKNLKEKAAPNIEITGFVKDPSPYFEKAHLAIMPLPYGAGIKVKVLECLGLGLPVMTNPVGAENVDATENDGLYVCTEIQAYLNALEKLLNEPSHYEALSQAALDWAKKMIEDFPEKMRSVLEDSLRD